MGRKTIEKCMENGYVSGNDLAILVRLYKNGRLTDRQMVWAVWHSPLSVADGDRVLDRLGVPEKIK